jgi:hypothetical protein
MPHDHGFCAFIEAAHNKNCLAVTILGSQWITDIASFTA